jgi:hypothetical protein
MLQNTLKKNLTPLVGHTSSFIKDSKYFDDNIKYLKMEEHDIKVSFDVVSLITKVL